MRIAFVIGSAEPGRNGVGDYTRRLAAEVSGLGHEASIVTTHDRHVVVPTLERQKIGERSVEAYRLPQATSTGDRKRLLLDRLSVLSPDLLSIQFVPHAFHSKGLYYRFIKLAEELSKYYRIHLMVHELWEGMLTDSDWKQQLRGKAQRALFTQFVGRVKPSIIHSQAKAYLRQIHAMGLNATQLPLFSNIAVADETLTPAPDCLRFVCFGSVYPGNALPTFMAEAAELVASKSETVFVDFIGHGGKHKDTIIAAAKSGEYGDLSALQVNDLGKMDAKDISLHLSSCHIGLTTTPYPVVDKSGAVASYLAHGLYTLGLSKGWELRDPIANLSFPGIVNYSPGTLDEFVSNYAHATPISYSAKEVASKMLSEMAV